MNPQYERLGYVRPNTAYFDEERLDQDFQAQGWKVEKELKQHPGRHLDPYRRTVTLWANDVDTQQGAWIKFQYGLSSSGKKGRMESEGHLWIQGPPRYLASAVRQVRNVVPTNVLRRESASDTRLENTAPGNEPSWPGGRDDTLSAGSNEFE